MSLLRSAGPAVRPDAWPGTTGLLLIVSINDIAAIKAYFSSIIGFLVENFQTLAGRARERLGAGAVVLLSGARRRNR